MTDQDHMSARYDSVSGENIRVRNQINVDQARAVSHLARKLNIEQGALNQMLIQC